MEINRKKSKCKVANILHLASNDLASSGVGERRIRGEVGAEAPVDCIRERMPE